MVFLLFFLMSILGNYALVSAIETSSRFELLDHRNQSPTVAPTFKAPLSVLDCKFILFAGNEVGNPDGFGDSVGLVMKPEVIMCVEQIARVTCESYTISVTCQTDGFAQYSAYTFFNSSVVAKNLVVDCAVGSFVTSPEDFVLRNEGAVELVVVSTCIQPVDDDDFNYSDDDANGGYDDQYDDLYDYDDEEEEEEEGRS
jgi:hypothetical protein